METTKPTPALLDEYGLSEYLYDALKACTDPTYWKTGDLTHSIALLYKLRDRGLLTGPKTGKPYSIPFHLTKAGRDLLSRVERGLHKPEWLSEHQVRALDWLSNSTIPAYSTHLLSFYKIRLVTIRSLLNAGYVSTDGIEYSLTPLGREAWQEYKESPLFNRSQEPKPERINLKNETRNRKPNHSR